MALTGQALRDRIGTPVAVFTLNRGEGAGVANHFTGITSYDPAQPSGPSPINGGPSPA